ncbi:MAG: hypothetical protein HC900_03490 [Methylacidiphilales bacterium]|nr:hypothetical protein [Candidatus Methylacidiphilales bacterium]
MRIVFAMLINIVFIGGLALYMSHRDKYAAMNAAPLKTYTAKKKYRLEITPAFALQPDPFTFTGNSSQKPALLSVKMGTTEVLRLTQPNQPGKAIFANISGLHKGDNELYIEASPPPDDICHALRVRILENSRPIADTTFWAEPGSLISDSFYFHLEEEHDR